MFVPSLPLEDVALLVHGMKCPFLPRGSTIYHLFEELGENLARCLLWVPVSLCLSSLSLPRGSKIKMGKWSCKDGVCPLGYVICNFCVLNFAEVCQKKLKTGLCETLNFLAFSYLKCIHQTDLSGMSSFLFMMLSNPAQVQRTLRKITVV